MTQIGSIYQEKIMISEDLKKLTLGVLLRSQSRLNLVQDPTKSGPLATSGFTGLPFWASGDTEFSLKNTSVKKSYTTKPNCSKNEEHSPPRLNCRD